MSNENLYYDLLHAYAIGCLDQKDLNILNEYLDTGGEFFWQELGEYQNVAALLPSILNIEAPGIELKDKVARKLYRIRNEKRTKAPEEKPGAVINEEKNEAPVQNEEKLSNLFSRTRVLIKEKESHKNITEQQPVKETEETPKPVEEKDFEPVVTKERFPEIIEIKHEDIKDTNSIDESSLDNYSTAEAEIDTGGVTENNYIPPKEENEKKPYRLHGIEEREKVTKSKGTGGIILSIILFLIAAAAIIYMYSKISSEVSVYKTGLQKLDNRVKDLSSQLAGSQEIQKLLQSKNVMIVNFSGTNRNSSGFGRLILNPETGKGYLQLNGMPQLPANEAYQIWTIINKKFVSLAVINPADGINFYPIVIPEINDKIKLTFLVSEEPSTGSPKPSKNIYLTGTME